MAKIDRLGWAAGFSFSSHGAEIGIRVNESEVRSELRTMLPPRSEISQPEYVDELYSVRLAAATQTGRMRQFHVIYRGATRIARSLDLNEALETMQSCFHMSVAERARDYLFVHAGVVGWRGKAIVIPGRSMAGKSSLVQALVRAGATYYSDEYAPIDAEGRVHPYPRALSMRIPGTEQRELLSALDLGGQEGEEPLPVGLIVVTRFREGARWCPQALTPGQALLALLDNTVLAMVKPQLALSTLGRVVPDATAIKSLRSGADRTAASLFGLLEPRSR